MAVIKVDENDPVGELEPSFPFRDVKILHNVDVRDYYDLKEEIGRGKFGTVYRCVEKKTGTVLAAKFVGIAKKQDRINVEREVEIMRTLQHPRLIQLYDSFEIHNVMCVVLELIEGGELFERVIDDDFILTEKACSVFMRQICEGVSFIHANNVIHLDLKPENILCLTKTGNRVKIIDFGLARKYDKDKKLQVLFGTPEFVAPEVVNFDEITSATDMWSVGVICYVLLSGLSPFMGESDLQTMTNVTMAQYDFDDEAFDTISADAKDFISKLLVKSKEKRMTAENCINHNWLRRKPPPPPMFLEQSKENLKTYVETIHTSSPFLLAESMSNGSINDMLISSTSELPKSESPEKTVVLFKLTPERTLPIDEQAKADLEEQNLKNKNELNLEKSVKPDIVIEADATADENEETPLNVELSFPSTAFKNRGSRKLIKTDSFKGLPRKFSITVESFRELPRRSSLSRTERGKIELKRENFVTFIGPREIKPIDPLSPDIRHAVEELTGYNKSNVEKPSSSKDKTSYQKSESPASSPATSVEHNLDDGSKPNKVLKTTENMQEDNIHSKYDVGSKHISITAIETNINKEADVSGVTLNTTCNVPINTSSITVQNAQERVKKKDDIPAFLRPADYIKSKNLGRDSSLTKIKAVETISSETIKFADKTNTDLSTNKRKIDKTPDASVLLATEIPNLKTSPVSTLTDPRESVNSIRNKSFMETVFKRQSGNTSFFKASSFDSQVSQSKLKSTDNVKSWFSSPLKNDLSLPRKFTLSNKNNDPVRTTKEPSPQYNEQNKTRASSLDPTSAGHSSGASPDQPFQSRFLRSSQMNSSRCSSEAPASKYEEFKNRYSNYKELASDNEKLFKRGFGERTPLTKTEKSDETLALVRRGEIRENNSQSSITTLKSSFLSQSSTSTSFMSRQKFKLTEQQRDSYNKFDSSSKLNKSETASSSFRSEKERNYSSVSGIKESTTVKHSQKSSQKSESKSKPTVPDKNPSSPQKKV